MPYIHEKSFGLRSDTVSAPHVMLTRQHGVSPPPYDSLNISYGVGDMPANVAKNRLRIKEMLGIRYLASARQVHAKRVYSVGSITGDVEVDGYDALVTERPDIGLLIQQADCQAILLHDPFRPAIGAIHCGWRGNVTNIIRSTIDQMRKNYRTDPSALHAVISPSMGPCCGEFIHFRTQLPSNYQQFQPIPGHFDFRAISRDQLIKAGVLEGNIDMIDVCTVCNTNFFSYRRTMKKGGKQTGRQGSIICLAPD
jgi:YfiH family protein